MFITFKRVTTSLVQVNPNWALSDDVIPSIKREIFSQSERRGVTGRGGPGQGGFIRFSIIAIYLSHIYFVIYGNIHLPASLF